MLRAAWVVLGLVFVVLGVAGVLLPVVPTTPFLLLASGCFVRSSPRLYRWLLNSRLLGPFLRDWYAHRGVRLHVKIFAMFMIVVAVMSSIYFGSLGPWLLALLLGLAAIGMYVVMSLRVIRE